METHGQEHDKIIFCKKYYGILPDNCYFTKSHNEKVKKLAEMRSLYKTSLPPVYIDDKTDVLLAVRNANIGYYTAHVTLFMR